MKPPTLEALRYAAVVLGRDCTQLERVVDHTLRDHGTPEPAYLDAGRSLLAHVRSVRAWILGVQMPIAQRREEKQRYHTAQVLATRPGRKACTECGELMAYDHSVCIYCATGTRPAAQCGDCGSTLAQVVGPNVQGAVCPVCDPHSSLLDDFSECAAEPLSPKDLKALKAAVAPLLPRKK